MNTIDKAQAFGRRNSARILGGIVCLLLLHDLFGAHGLLALHRTRRQIAVVEQEISRLNEENQKLADQAKALETDPDAIEKVARDEMGLARPGELVFKLPKPAEKKPDESTSNPR